VLRAKLRRAGTPIGDFDEMIAAHALSLDAVLVTDNTRHFQMVEGLALENWIRNN
jgi:tRNA(fMet)-specific endonuclease VapC